jgi:type III secretion protein L
MTRVLKGRGVIKPEYLKTLESSREVVEAARRAASQIEDEARTRADKVEREAERRGYDEGMARAAAALAETEARRRNWLDEARKDLASLALEAARALFTRTREQDPAVLEDVCREALERVAGARRIVVRVAPDEVSRLAHLESAHEVSVRVKADPEIEPGGCVVETDLGTVDGRMSTRLDTLKRALEEVIARHRTGEQER